MKRYLFIALIPFMAAAALFAYGARNFRYFAELGQLAPATMYRIHLKEDILSKSLAGCDDVRILDAKGKEVSRVIVVQRVHSEVPAEHSLEVTSYDPATRTVIARFPGNAAAVNAMTLDIPDSDFRRRITLSGSMNGTAWTVLQHGLIYDYTSQINLRSTTIRFPKSNYTYYRLTLTGAAKNGGTTMRLSYGDLNFEVDSGGEREIRIDGITVSWIPGGVAAPQYDTKSFIPPKLVPGDESTDILLEAQLPVDRIIFAVKNPLFYRRVLLYGGEDAKAESFLTEGMLFHAPALEQAERRDWIVCSAEKHRYYLFKIVNGDNPPLRIDGITLQWHPRLLFFMSDDGGPYRLCFGNPGAKAPEYDLVNYINEDNWETRAYNDLPYGAVQERLDYSPGIPEAIKDRLERWILTAVVLLITGIIGFWLYRIVRGAKK